MRVAHGSCLVAAALACARPALAQDESYQQLQTFSYLLSQVRLNYVEPVTTEQLVRASINGMLHALDPFSRFVPREENEREVAWQQGHLAGTGMLLEDEDGAVSVAAVLAGSPAARARILPGDRVVALNDTVAAGRTAHDLQMRMLGEDGSRVRVRIERGPRFQPETLTISLRNAILPPRSVTVARTLASGVGYVRLEQFNSQALQEVHRSVGRVLRGRPGRLILDLRGNPGGLVQAAVDVAGEFLPNDVLVCRSEGRRREMDHEFKTASDGAYKDVRMVVLVDERTASAAEMLSGALQDHDRARLMGRTTFGKALIQRMYEVPPNGDVVWLTVGYVHTPSGRLIQRRYHGLSAEQFIMMAGHGASPDDTLKEFKTDSGRVVRGGGGIRPDTILPAPARPPLWWTVAADSGFEHAVADSVAATLPGDAKSRDEWLHDSTAWRSRVEVPFLARVRARLHIAAPDGAQPREMAVALAARVARVRWGDDFADEFLLDNDPDVRAAEAWLARGH